MEVWYPKKKRTIEEGRSIEGYKRVKRQKECQVTRQVRIALTQDAVPLTAKMKNEDTVVDVSQRRKKSTSETASVPQNKTARPTVENLVLKVKNRTKSKTPAHKIKYARQPPMKTKIEKEECTQTAMMEQIMKQTKFFN